MTSGRINASATLRQRFGRGEEIVDAPADVACTGEGDLVPPGVLLGQVGVEEAKRIDITQARDLVEPGSLFRQEPGDGLVLLGPRQVDLTVGGVHVAAEDDSLAGRAQRLALVEECVVEGQLERHSAVIAAAVGKVTVEQHKIGVFGDDRPPLPVELLDPKSHFDAQRRLAGEDGRAAVALFAARWVPEGVVAGRLAQFGRELVLVGAGLLQADDVRIGGGQPVHETVLVNRPRAVDVPG